MVVENKSVLEGNKIRENLILITKKSFIPKAVTIFLLLVITVLMVVFGFKDKNYANLFAAAIFLFFDIYYFVNGIKAFKAIPKKIDEENKFLLNNTITYHFKFKEKSVLLFAIVNDMNRRLEYKYEDIKKINEFHNRYEFRLKDNTFLYMYKNSYITEKGDEFFKKNLKLNKVKLKYIK